MGNHSVKGIAKKYFDRWALTYDTSILQHIVFNTSHNMLFNEITAGTPTDTPRILDVGCGTGKLSYKLADHFKGAEVHGVDLSSTMIEKANAKNKANEVRFKIGDVENLPYEDNTFDVITCSHSFHHYPNKDKAIAEMYRVLKPEGRLMIIDGCRDVIFGRIIFNIVEKIEKHVYHLFGREFRSLFQMKGFNNTVQKRFNFVPLLLTIGTAIKQ